MSTLAATGMSVFTGPSQSPARVFIASKEVCASDFGAGALGSAILCASDCAKATVASDIRTTDKTKRRDFMFHSPVRRLNRRGVVNAKVIRKWISDPYRPRVMRSRSQGRRRSVDRGTCGPGIEPRKILPPGCRRCRRKRKAASDASQSRDALGPCAVTDPVHVRKHFAWEPGGPLFAQSSGPRREVQGCTPMMNGQGKSDRPVVPQKSPNKAGRPAAEGMEGRGLAKGNLSEQNALRMQSRVSAQSALERVRQAAKKDRTMRFTALLHHVYSLDTLREAYFSLKKEAAPGVDGQTWWQYGEALEEHLQDLAARLKRGAYRAKPVRRVYIAKDGGGQRPLGVTALEDKIVQRAAVVVLNAIYETDFLGFSYGFRPGRSQHDCLDALYAGLLTRPVNWVLDVDIRGFFDSIDHGWLVKFIEHRIADRRIVRLIQKWLTAGVLEDGKHRDVEQGTPQGGSASPLL